LGSTLFHVVMLLAISAVILSPVGNEPRDRDEFGVAPLESMELAMGDEEELIEMPAEEGPASLGPFAAGNQISLPGERAGSVGNVQQGPVNAGAYVPRPGQEEVSPFAPADEFGVGGIASELEALSNPLASRGGGLEGRKFENRYGLALAGGGSKESEAAVEAGLAWMAEHQLKNGGWNFDLEKKCPQCAGYCRNSGTYTSTTAATGLALLSFLGAGYTHKEGKYQEVVARGLYYLEERMTVTSHGGDLRDSQSAPEATALVDGAGRLQLLSPLRRDTMYSHGIATLALTEAYAMTGDSSLRKPAEEAVKFIVNAQYDDGGWRYPPKWEYPGPGDVTVTGWQLMALKSGLLAGIDVPYEVWMKAAEFLDGLQEEGGAKYQYVRGERGTAATAAVGLLCRMIGGWPKEHRPLQKGASAIGALSPSQENMYFNYYASQVLHHLGGRTWERWNPRMRDYLVNTQQTNGHEQGSWYFPEAHSTPGGRLYTTAMAIMTLEVYYRYMPLYKEPFIGRAP